MKKLKAFINIVITAILILFIGVLCMFLTSKFIFKDKVPNVFGYSILKVMSGSMQPSINIGDFVIIKKTGQYNSGDVVTYLDENDSLVTHRIIEINKSEIITKGDFNNTNDLEINKNDIQGKVVFIIKDSLFSMVVIIVATILIGVISIRFIVSLLITDKQRR